MSRIAKSPVAIPAGVEVKINGRALTIKGGKGEMTWDVHKLVDFKQEGDELLFSASDSIKTGWALAGTTRSLVQNMVTGVSAGFEKKLQLTGVGYRAKVEGNVLSLTLGFSHPVDYKSPEGITIETPSQTEIVVKGSDKQKIGQVAADIRAFRPPEPYKGKGVRYADEQVRRKVAKKK